MVPTSTSRAPERASTSGMRKPSPISTSSPRETSTSRPSARAATARSTAAALLLTTSAASAPVRSREERRRRAPAASRATPARGRIRGWSSRRPTSVTRSRASFASGARPRFVCTIDAGRVQHPAQAGRGDALGPLERVRREIAGLAAGVDCPRARARAPSGRPRRRSRDRARTRARPAWGRPGARLPRAGRGEGFPSATAADDTPRFSLISEADDRDRRTSRASHTTPGTAKRRRARARRPGRRRRHRPARARVFATGLGAPGRLGRRRGCGRALPGDAQARIRGHRHASRHPGGDHRRGRDLPRHALQHLPGRCGRERAGAPSTPRGSRSSRGSARSRFRSRPGRTSTPSSASMSRAVLRSRTSWPRSRSGQSPRAWPWRAGRPVVVDGREGTGVDEAAAIEALTATALAGLPSLTVPVQTAEPAISTAAAERAATIAGTITAAPVRLRLPGEGEVGELGRFQLASLVRFQPKAGAVRVVLDPAGVEREIRPLAKPFTEKPVDATFQISGERAYVVKARDGTTLDVAGRAACDLRGGQRARAKRVATLALDEAPARADHEGREGARDPRAHLDLHDRHGRVVLEPDLERPPARAVPRRHDRQAGQTFSFNDGSARGRSSAASSRAR